MMLILQIITDYHFIVNSKKSVAIHQIRVICNPIKNNGTLMMLILQIITDYHFIVNSKKSVAIHQIRVICGPLINKKKK